MQALCEKSATIVAMVLVNNKKHHGDRLGVNFTCLQEVSYRLAMAVLSSSDKSAASEATSNHRSDGSGACGDHGGGQSKLTEKGQEIPRNFDVEKSVERTKNAGN